MHAKDPCLCPKDEDVRYTHTHFRESSCGHAAARSDSSTCGPLTGSFVTQALRTGSCERVSLSSSPTYLNLTLVQTLLIHFHLLLKTSLVGGISLTGIPKQALRKCFWRKKKDSS